MKKNYLYSIITIFIFLLYSCSPTKMIVEQTQEEQQTVEVITPTQPIISETESTPEEVNEALTSVIEPVITEKFNHSIFDMLLEENVTDDGRTDYKGFIKNKSTFTLYLTALSDNMPMDNWSKEDKLAYWMNAYNAFTIKLIIDNYPTSSIKDIKDPWDKRFFKLGTKWYNLNEIEHQILRKMGDARIHFGINCASFSCPPLLNGAFTAETVDSKLDFLAHQFINDPLRNVLSEDKIQISKIFQWFGKDFKTNGSIIDFLNQYSEITVNSNAKKSYVKYNWNLNE